MDDYHYVQLDQTTDTLTLQEYGKIAFNIGPTKTQKMLVNSTTCSILNDVINYIWFNYIIINIKYSR